LKGTTPEISGGFRPNERKPLGEINEKTPEGRIRSGLRAFGVECCGPPARDRLWSEVRARAAAEWKEMNLFPGGGAAGSGRSRGGGAPQRSRGVFRGTVFRGLVFRPGGKRGAEGRFQALVRREPGFPKLFSPPEAYYISAIRLSSALKKTIPPESRPALQISAKILIISGKRGKKI
jgi:hypothetical protein